MSSTTLNNYVLKVGPLGAKNLDLQHEIIKMNSINQLYKAGLKEDMIVWDIGCGSGVMTEFIARTVGSKGHVYAVDVSKEQIEVARKRMDSAGIKNITFIISDIYLLKGKYNPEGDIVYSRLILMHLQKPEQAIRVMSTLLKKDGGTLSLQESSMNSIFEGKNLNDNVFHSLKRYYELINTYSRINSLNYDIGAKLPRMCKELEIFSKIDYYTSNYDLIENKQLFFSRFEEFKDRILETELTTEQELISLEHSLKILFNSSELKNQELKFDQHHLILTCKP